MSPNGMLDRPQFAFKIYTDKKSGMDFGVFAFTASERMSRPFDVRVTLVSKEEIKFDDVMNKEAVLDILGKADEHRYFHGIISEFVQGGRAGDFHFYRARLVPTLWRLSLEQDCRIFQEKKITEIVKEILEEGETKSDRYLVPKKLEDSYEPKTYCVQYRETDLNFISRLLEEEGIFYFFEHAKDKHVLVLGDDPVSYKTIEGEKEVTFNDAESMVPKEDFVSVFNMSRQVHTGKITIKDYNFETPAVDLTRKSEKDPFKNLEVYDYPAEYGEQNTGEKIAKVRLEEATMYYEKADGKSDCARFTPGFTFKLADHPRDHDPGNWNQEYLLVEVIHRGTQPQVLEERAATGGTEYSNEFLCIQSSVSFRPERNTPKPVVEGVQTAIVVGKEGEEIYTDKHGRVKVQFHWDRKGEKNEKSSCWIRVGQVWAGREWGAMFIPRITQEVIIDFIEGDPDRPIIIGSVYHGENPPPYNPENSKTKSTIKSNTTPSDPDAPPDDRGFNEIRIEDKKGEEELFLHAQKNLQIRAKNDRAETIGHDRNLVVENDKKENIKNDRSEIVSNNHKEEIGGNRNLKVVGKQVVAIDDTLSVTVGANVNEVFKADHSEKVAGQFTVQAADIVFEADTNVTFKVGQSFIAISSSGIKISSTGQIVIDAGASAELTSTGNVTIKGTMVMIN
ncbi:MAG: type VI secretion system tip protein VgrG [Deltaproteobacteria bacterium]|nr:type VI secretion system tip protein VgrG [Deltaproteobacteria bacterium]